MIPDNVTVLGDPHLGRKFRTGVPLHRIGDREQMQWRDFLESLTEADTDLHVNMGDLFDKRVVSPETVLMAANAYIEAAELNPTTTYVVLMGNHDVSRNADWASSFDLFEALVTKVSNIIVVSQAPRVIAGYGFVPYSVFETAEEMVAKLPDNLEAVFGHWDIQDWGGDNVIPTKKLADKGIKLAISGHDHLSREETRHGVDIIVTGSMQPYSHGEDPDEAYYLTTELPITDNVKNMNVRLILKPGETPPEDLDCLSLVTRYASADDKIEVDTSEFESLDLRQMLDAVLEDLECKDELMGAFDAAE